MILKELQLKRYPYKTRRHLSERLVRAYFQKKGYEVFRGRSVFDSEFSSHHGLFENVRRTYDRLEEILDEKLGSNLQAFRETLTSGIPDFLIHRPGEYIFVEVRLEHEPIQSHHLSSMAFLEGFGFDVMVLRVKTKPYRLQVKVDPDENEIVMVRQNGLRISNLSMFSKLLPGLLAPFFLLFLH